MIGSSKMKTRIEFLFAAINEAQSTVRALDVKIAALLVCALAPVPMLAPIAGCFFAIYKTWDGLIVGGLQITFCLTWAGSMILFSLALGAISNPALHVRSAKNNSGAFYGPGMYDFNLLDAISPRASKISLVDPSAHLASIPNNEVQIELELAFEHLKVIYIRDVKLIRLKYGYRLASCALVIGSASYAFGRYYLTECGA